MWQLRFSLSLLVKLNRSVCCQPKSVEQLKNSYLIYLKKLSYISNPVLLITCGTPVSSVPEHQNYRISCFNIHILAWNEWFCIIYKEFNQAAGLSSRTIYLLSSTQFYCKLKKFIHPFLSSIPLNEFLWFLSWL